MTPVKPLFLKAYGCIFVCFSVKAVHIELISDTSTAAFLAALDRFVAHRGLPAVLYSECGTDFVGAAKEFSKLLQASKNTEEYLNSRNIRWQFNPPAAPDFGGVFEAAVKSAKGHLVRRVGNKCLKVEELSTILARVESVLNSR